MKINVLLVLCLATFLPSCKDNTVKTEKANVELATETTSEEQEKKSIENTIESSRTCVLIKMPKTLNYRKELENNSDNELDLWHSNGIVLEEVQLGDDLYYTKINKAEMANYVWLFYTKENSFAQDSTLIYYEAFEEYEKKITTSFNVEKCQMTISETVFDIDSGKADTTERIIDL